MRLDDIMTYAIPAFAVLLLVEWWAYRRDPDRGRRGISGRDTATSLSIFTIGRLTKPLARFVAPLSGIVAASAATPLHLSAGAWWVWPLTLVVTDFCYYWAHRADHRIRLLWSGHSVHHSSQYFNLSTAVRLPWLIPGTEMLRELAWVPAALLGIPVWMIALFRTIGLLYQFPLHTERIGKLPRAIELVLNTPSHHRVHHGANNPYLDKNYGGVFIFWDRLFGSFTEEREPIRYGLTKNINTHNPVKANYFEFTAMLRDLRHARSWKARTAHLFGPPGWTERHAPTDELTTTADSTP